MTDFKNIDEDIFVLNNIGTIIQKIKQSICRLFVDAPLSERDFLFLEAINNASRTNGVTASELSKFFGVSRSAASQFIVSLERRGYISGKSDNVDKRKTYLSVTPDGEAILNEYRTRFSNMIHSIKEEFGHEKFETLISLSSDIADIFEKTTSNNEF